MKNFTGLLNALWILLILSYPEFNFIIVLHCQREILEAIVDLPVLNEHLTEEFLRHLELICSFKDLLCEASSHLLLAKAYVIHHVLQHFVLVLLAIDEIRGQELLAVLNEPVARRKP